MPPAAGGLARVRLRRRVRELRRRAEWVADVYRTPTVAQWTDRTAGAPPGPDPARRPADPDPTIPMARLAGPQWTVEPAGDPDRTVRMTGQARPQWTAEPAGRHRPLWTAPHRLGPTGTMPLPRSIWPGRPRQL